MSNVDAKRVVTGQARLSYVNLVKPRANEDGGEPKYSVTILIPKADYATKQRIDIAIQTAIQEGVTTKWNGAKPAQPAIPVYDGDGVRPNGEAFTEECKGHWVFTASSLIKPEVVDANMNVIINPTEIYSGMYARVSVRFYPYLAKGKKGVAAGLGNVQKLGDGEPLGGGRSSANDDFGDGFSAQAQQQYAPPQPQYQPPTYQQPQYQQPVQQQYAPPQPQYQQPVQPQIDPITGMPVVGSVLGM